MPVVLRSSRPPLPDAWHKNSMRHEARPAEQLDSTFVLELGRRSALNHKFGRLLDMLVGNGVGICIAVKSSESV